jgi:Na+-translocating ferredoxin:NAD+ oxidoreductase subunit B
VFGVPLVVVALCVLGLVVGVPLLRPRREAPRDPGRLAEAVLEVLPGGNCGACGNDSCFETAAAVASGRAPRTACAAGGPVTASAVAAVLRAYAEHHGG